ENRKGFYQAKRKLEQQQLLPDISFSYSIGSNSSLNENLYKYQIGVKITLIFSGNDSKIRASKIAMEISEQQAADYELQFTSKQTQLMQELSKYSEALKYYQIEGKSLSEEILKTASGRYKNRESDFYKYIQSLENI